MRPKSIIMFERLFLASLALGALNFLLGYEDLAQLAANDPGLRRLGLGSGFLVGIVAASYAVYLLLWHLIARRASNMAKWILVLFAVLGLLSALPTLRGPWDATLALALVVYALEVLAIVYLFRVDAKAWFEGTDEADPAALD
jgi:hypothetical protein